MSKGVRTVVGILMVVLTLVVVCVFLSYRSLRKSLPKTEGEIELADLRAEVKVYRDDYGVPHIFAHNENDLYFAAGYVVAQDRLWQLDILRRIACGRLSEVLGRTALDSDKFLRTLGFKRTAQRIVHGLSLQSMNLLTAYARGINAYIRESQRRLPMEFTVLKYRPQEWRVEDSIAIGRLIAWGLSFAWRADVLLGAIVDKLGPQKAKELFPDYSSDWPTIVPSQIEGMTNVTQGLFTLDDGIRELLLLDIFPSGSNSWVVSGAKSNSGRPILANDPHLELATPSPWYEMHLVCKDLDVYGVTFPGIPGVVIGHNKNLAWGLTNAMIDDADFYIEKINPDNPNQYWHGYQWRNMEIVKETIAVKDGSTVNFSVRLTRHGPIVSNIHDLLKDSKKAISLRWTGHQISDEVLGFYKINKAHNWQQFIDGLRDLRVPGQNVLYADVDGNIGYWCAASVPIRKNGEGMFPRPGWTDSYEWAGFVPFEELPHVLNPSQHYIATANNRIIVDESYPYYISDLWEPPSRIERIREMLAEKDTYGLSDFKSMQVDYLSPLARKVVPYILKVLEREKVKNQRMEEIYRHLKGWDFQELPESSAATIFNVFLIKFLENTYKDELGKKLYENFIKLPSLPLRATRRFLENKDYSWFDDTTTADRIESLEEIVSKSIGQAADFLTQKLGKEVIDWRWDKLHTVTFRHFLGARSPMSRIFNQGPFPRGGSYTTVNCGGYDFLAPYRSFYGPTTRQIVDLANIDSCLAVTPPGQSGHPLSKHFRDQVALWLNGRYRTVILDSTEITRAGYELMILKPQG